MILLDVVVVIGLAAVLLSDLTGYAWFAPVFMCAVYGVVRFADRMMPDQRNDEEIWP